VDVVGDFAIKYRLSLILGIISIVCILVSFLFRTRENPSSIIFTTNEATPSGQLPNTISVDIEGQVNIPGVYEMDIKSRVNDIIVKAGGFSSEADLDWIAKFVNKAQLLHDGDKLYIPSVNEKTGGDATVMGTVSARTVVNINTASLTELEMLPGIGEKTAEKIVQARPYNSTQDLRDKKVVGQAIFEKIKDLISVL